MTTENLMKLLKLRIGLPYFKRSRDKVHDLVLKYYTKKFPQSVSHKKSKSNLKSKSKTNKNSSLPKTINRKYNKNTCYTLPF